MGTEQARTERHPRGARGKRPANVATGLPVLDHLLERARARTRAFDLALEVEPGTAEAEVAAAGSALGHALAEPAARGGARGYGSASMTVRGGARERRRSSVSDEPLARLERRPHRARASAGSAPTRAPLPARLAEGAGVTLHVRLLERQRPQHVLEAIFKALGVALGAGLPTATEERRVATRPSSAPRRPRAVPGRAVLAGDPRGRLVFVSGQLALKPGDKELSGGTIEEQTEQVFANLRAILEEAGSGLDRLVKTTVFLQDLDDFQGMN